MSQFKLFIIWDTNYWNDPNYIKKDKKLPNITKIQEKKFELLQQQQKITKKYIIYIFQNSMIYNYIYCNHVIMPLKNFSWKKMAGKRFAKKIIFFGNGPLKGLLVRGNIFFLPKLAAWLLAEKYSAGQHDVGLKKNKFYEWFDVLSHFLTKTTVAASLN